MGSKGLRTIAFLMLISLVIYVAAQAGGAV